MRPPCQFPGEKVPDLLGCFYLEFLKLISLVSREKARQLGFSEQRPLGQLLL